MNIALIIAGGVGARMEQSIPKQFIHIAAKPVIVYTVVCVADKHDCRHGQTFFARRRGAA